MNKKMIENTIGKNLKSILRRTETELNICCYYDREGYFDYAHRGNVSIGIGTINQ
ncbi:MAG: hypothetical protein HFH60_03555 [Lachnospiraceae bacterium]|jgi:hypothetical protein|nr:hypothetical protein [Lachnospiraceae bacterium]